MKLEKTLWVLIAMTTLFITFTFAFFMGRNSIHAVVTTQSVTNETPAQITTAVSPEDTPEDTQDAPAEELLRVNLNTATPAELEELPGIGPKLAERIVAWREENGGFVSVEQLMDINGIAEGKYDEIKDLVYVEVKE